MKTPISNSNEGIQSVSSYFSSLVNPHIEEYANKKIRFRLPLIPIGIVKSILSKVTILFRNEPNTLEIDADTIIIGDLCGHLLDLLRILRRFGPPDQQKYLFLGNLIDQNDYHSLSFETLMFIYSMKILHPDSIFILRGPNEYLDPQSLFEVMSDFYGDSSLNPLINTAFLQTPTAALISQEQKKFLCVHGGIGPSFERLSELNEINRGTSRSTHPIILDILFSDPTEALPMFLPSNTGFGCLYGSEAIRNFLNVNKISCIIRGNTPVPEGFQTQFDDQLITVYSCSATDFQANSAQSVNKSGIYQINKFSEGSNFEPIPTLKRNEVQFLESEKDDVLFFTQKPSLTEGRSTRNVLQQSARSVVGGMRSSQGLAGRSQRELSGLFMRTRNQLPGVPTERNKRASANFSRQNLVLKF